MYKHFYFSIIIFVAIVTGYLAGKNDIFHPPFPRSFTILFDQDDSSASGNREYSGTLVFSKGVLVEGSLSYNTSTLAEERHENCIVKNQILVDEVTQDLCNFDSPIAFTRLGLLTQIRSGELVKNACKHGDICYNVMD